MRIVPALYSYPGQSAHAVKVVWVAAQQVLKKGLGRRQFPLPEQVRRLREALVVVRHVGEESKPEVSAKFFLE